MRFNKIQKKKMTYVSLTSTALFTAILFALADGYYSVYLSSIYLISAILFTFWIFNYRKVNDLERSILFSLLFGVLYVIISILFTGMFFSNIEYPVINFGNNLMMYSFILVLISGLPFWASIKFNNMVN